MLGFYYSTDKIVRIMFIVTVSILHCSSTNHNSARCRLHTAPPPAKCIQRHTTVCPGLQACCYDRNPILRWAQASTCL